MSPWWMAIRPKTLTAAFISVLVGVALAYSEGHSIDLWIGFLTLLVTLLFQIASNLFNDVLDFQRGADTRERRGFRRVVEAGLLSPQAVLRCGYIVVLLAFLFGIPLVMKGGISIGVALVLGAVTAYCYTGGVYPLAYNGLGEVFVLLFFGFIGVSVPYFLQTGVWSFPPLLAGLQVGLLAVVLIAINNFRDIETDRKAGKWTLAARYGDIFARMEIMACIWVPFLVTPFWSYLGHGVASFLPLALVPFAFLITQGIWKPSALKLANGYFVLSALLHLSFGLLLSLGLAL